MSTIAGHGAPEERPDATHASPSRVVEHLPCVTFRLSKTPGDRPPAITYVSAQASELLGVEPETVLLDPSVLFDRIPSEDLAHLRAGLVRAFATLSPWHQEFRVRLRGSFRWFECHARIHQPSAGPLCADGYLNDITERKAADDRMRLWTSVLEQSAKGIMICDPERRIVAVNPAFERLTGFSQEDAIGQTPRIIYSGRQDPAFYADMSRAIAATGHWSGELWNRRKNGELYAEWLTVNAIYDSAGRLTHYVGLFSDITDRKAAEDRMRYLAHYDTLTDLPNRSVLRQELERLIGLTSRDTPRVAVLFLDLDGFKQINDSKGHETGDLLLQTMAHRLRSGVRHSDTVARMGGDEFVILMSGLHHSEDAARLARELLTSVNEPILLGGEELRVSASIGIGVFPDDGSQAKDLLRHADIAMYRAKASGRNRYEFFAREMNEQEMARA